MQPVHLAASVEKVGGLRSFGRGPPRSSSARFHGKWRGRYRPFREHRGPHGGKIIGFVISIEHDQFISRVLPKPGLGLPGSVLECVRNSGGERKNFQRKWVGNLEIPNKARIKITSAALLRLGK